MWKSVAGMSLPANAMTELQTTYLKQATELWNQTLTRLQPEGATKRPPPRSPTSVSHRPSGAPTPRRLTPRRCIC